MNVNTMTLKAAGVCLLITVLSGCAAIREATCTTNAGYSQGINDARKGQDMDSNYASICQVNQAPINRAYRRGYTVGLRYRAESTPSTQINIDNSRGRGGRWSCLTSFTQQVCGYGCVKDNFQNVYCGQRRRDNCVTNTFGVTKCGLHCRVDQFNNIACEKERYSKGSKRP